MVITFGLLAMQHAVMMMQMRQQQPKVAQHHVVRVPVLVVNEDDVL